MATNGIAASALRSAIDGEVFGSTDPGFEAACLGFNLAHEFRPDIAVLPRSSRDVAAAVRHAADHGLEVHVQATGHGLGTQTHGGMLVNTAGLQELDLDPEARSVRVGAGVRWSKVIAAAAPHGLAPLNGSSPEVGVVGYTMGGGIGPMGRTFGFAADHVTALRMVTASGDTLEVDAEREPELFWALRGGKCSVGIVTQLQFALHPVAEVYGGGIFFAGQHAPELFHAFGPWARSLPESTTASIALLRLPDAPEFPEPLRGKTTVHLRYVHVGGDQQGAALLAPMRGTAGALVDMVAMMPYSLIGSVHQDPTDPMPAWDASLLLGSLDAGAIDALLETAGPKLRIPLILAELRHLGGAFARQPKHPNAVGRRDAAFAVNVVGPYAPPLQEAVAASGLAVLDAMEPWSHGGPSINFSGFSWTPQDVRKAWEPGHVERLRRIKAGWDPDSRFRFGYQLD